MLLFAQSNGPGKWQLKYFYDHNDSSLTLTDFKFPSTQRGIASGFVTKKVGNAIFGDHEKAIPVVLITANGGTSWDEVVVKEIAESLFFLNDSTGWLVGPEAIWMTTESGRSWRRVAAIKNLTAVHFLNAKRGFAAGDADRALETEDGGVTWKPIQWESGPTPRPLGVVYRMISFSDEKNGIMGGEVPLSDHLPDDRPPRLLRPRKELNAFLTTHDGGKTWHRAVNSMYGELTRASLGPDQTGMGLVQHSRAYPWPSEVFQISLADEKINHLLYRGKNRAITDVVLDPDGESFLAGYEPPGDIHPSPIPGKVRILVSRDSVNWEEMSVDYRAVGRVVWLATPGAGVARSAVWAATDTGMILKLNPGK